MQAALIVNPAARAAAGAIQAVVAASVRLGWRPPLVLATSIAQPGAEQAAAALAAGADRLIVAGGDGTLRHVAGVLAATAAPGGENPATVPLGVVPVGAANIVARNLGLHRHRLDEAAGIALTGVPRPLSVGWVACQVGGVWGAEMPMLAVAGIGRDAQAIATTRPWLKSRLGWLAYAESGGRQAWRGALPMTVQIDDGPAQAVQAWSVLVAALPRLPLGVVAFPGVAPGGATLEVLRVDLRHPAQWGAVAVKGLAHTTGSVGALHYSQARQVVVRPLVPGPAQIDGDLIPDVEALRVRLQTGAVRVAVASPSEPRPAVRHG